MTEQNKVQWVYSAKNEKELAERYDQWASTYDADLSDEFGYRSPQFAVEVFSRYVPTEARVLDAGAGTGLVGQLLARKGYRNLVAIDLSRGMLEEARKKGVYRELRQMVLGETLDFADHAFDATICVGTLTIAHAPPASLDELVRITRAGGHIVCTLRADTLEEGGFKEKLESLESAGRWKLAEVTEPFAGLPKGEPDIRIQVWAYQVLSGT